MFSLPHTSIDVITLEMPSDGSIYKRFFSVENLEQAYAIICVSCVSETNPVEDSIRMDF